MEKENFKTPTVYAVGGGKGGIGKSFISSNLALFFSRKKISTLIIDLDFGGANAHTYLNTQLAGPSIKDFLSGSTSHLGEVVTKTPFPNLSLIRGAADWDEVMSLDAKSLQQFFKSVRDLGFEKIIYDLGAGTGFETIEAFIDADVRLAVSSPEPISIENTYQFLKRVFYRQLQSACEQLDCKSLVDDILNNKQELKISTPSSLIKHIKKTYPEMGATLDSKIQELKSITLVNQARSPKDRKISGSIAHIARQYFGFPVENAGCIDFDNRVWQSVRSMKPLFMESPDSDILRDFRDIFNQLEKHKKTSAQTDGKGLYKNVS